MKALNFNQTQTAVAICIKKLVLIAALSMGETISHGQEYQVVCKRLTGCPVTDGTCPSCEIVWIGKTQEELNAKIDRMLEEYRAEIEKKYGPNFSEVNRSNRKPSGWETYVYPTWKGLRVLF